MNSTPPSQIDSATVWIVEVDSPPEGRHIHGVYADESGAHRAVVDLMTTRFAQHWPGSSVRIPARADFATSSDWHHAVLAAWTLIDPPAIWIVSKEWQPQ
ncbi:hypothetical protein [Williamsia maris]|uniref:Uncharacterized protein n=1 Tax=Williamsia maris TaxID=72806 RepID=A0ABT1HJC0_9NOCA|nr:hypothetical protein [Williamsia maris]MCP2178019.1 hypothetical protein [Williamsia maris]